MNSILPIALYTNGVGFPIQFAYRPKATPFAGEACETTCKHGKLLEDSRNTVRSHLARFNIADGTYVLRGVISICTHTSYGGDEAGIS